MIRRRGWPVLLAPALIAGCEREAAPGAQTNAPVQAASEAPALPPPVEGMRRIAWRLRGGALRSGPSRVYALQGEALQLVFDSDRPLRLRSDAAGLDAGLDAGVAATMFSAARAGSFTVSAETDESRVGIHFEILPASR